MQERDTTQRSIRPLPGYAVVRLDLAHGRNGLTAGGLYVPQMEADRRITTGVVVRATLTEKQKREWPGMDGLEGLRVKIENGAGIARIGKELARVALDQIAAILPADVTDKAAQTRFVPLRCTFCGPARSAASNNAMLMVESESGEWYCPRCYRNAQGGMVNPDVVKSVGSGEFKRFDEMVDMQRWRERRAGRVEK